MKKIVSVVTVIVMLSSMCLPASAEEMTSVIMSSGTTLTFTVDPVAEEDLNTILEAGLSAASAMNQQPWYFSVITNQNVMDEIAASETSDDAVESAELGDSPVAIVIYMDEFGASANPSFDCGLACQNMVVAAKALGYGAKIVTESVSVLNGENHDTFCTTLGVDAAMNAVAVLLIGYEESASSSDIDTVYSMIEEKVSFVQ